MKTDPASPLVVVVGAGIAGLSAAHVLSDAGVAVTILEKNAYVGGRCFSYLDPELGHTVEHGIHAVFPRYANLLRLWREVGLGGDGTFVQTNTTGMVGPDGRMHATELARVHGPAPFFLLQMMPPGVMRARDYLSGTLFLARSYASRWAVDRDLDDTTFAAALHSCGVSKRMTDLLLVPYVRNLSYARADEVSARAAASALEYFALEHARDFHARFFDGGPSALVFDPWKRALEARGVRFLLGTPAEQVLMQRGRFAGVATRAAFGAPVVRGDAVVLALDLASAKALLPHELALNRSVEGLTRLRTTSVIVMRMRFVAGTNGRHRWSGPDSGVFAAPDFLDNFFVLHTFQSEFRAQPDLFLECHVGDAQTLEHLSDDDLFDRALVVLDKYFSGERLPERLDRERSRVLRHRDLFPLFAPGDEARTPSVSDPSRPDVLLAGDWVRPDDPGNRSWFMERAAVTGIEAANAVLRAVHRAGPTRAVARPSSPPVSRWARLPFSVRDRLSVTFRRLLDV
jgi:isorenieratene synthase